MWYLTSCASPPVAEYTQTRSSSFCRQFRGGRHLGMCVHDLQTLLEWSKCYSYAWLKEERNVWHPPMVDRFARYCYAECREELKWETFEGFVLYGILPLSTTRYNICHRHSPP